MSDVERLRGLLRERQENEEVRGTAHAEIHLNTKLVEDWAKLKAEKDELERAARRADSGRLASAPPADTADVDQRIADKEAEIKATTVRLEFRAVAARTYRETVERYPDVDKKQDQKDAFLDELATAGLFKITVGGGDPLPADELLKVFAELQADLSFGEWDPIRDVVFNLNRRKISVPFS